jgi:hypothetical protein
MNILPPEYRSSVDLFMITDYCLTFVIDSEEIQTQLINLGFPIRYMHRITGMVIVYGNSEIKAVWLTESGHPEHRYTTYHPLPFYKPREWDEYGLQSYWMETNLYYQRS